MPEFRTHTRGERLYSLRESSLNEAIKEGLYCYICYVTEQYVSPDSEKALRNNLCKNSSKIGNVLRKNMGAAPCQSQTDVSAFIPLIEVAMDLLILYCPFYALNLAKFKLWTKTI